MHKATAQRETPTLTYQTSSDPWLDQMGSGGGLSCSQSSWALAHVTTWRQPADSHFHSHWLVL